MSTALNIAEDVEELISESESIEDAEETLNQKGYSLELYRETELGGKSGRVYELEYEGGNGTVEEGLFLPEEMDSCRFSPRGPEKLLEE